MLVQSYSNAYWVGQPIGYPAGTVYGSARGGLVSTPVTDTAYQAWLAEGYKAWPWPSDETGAETTAALDYGLTTNGLPPTGLTAPTQAQLAASVLSACRSAANAVLAQIYPDPIHQAAGQNAAMIAAVSGGAPTSTSPFYAAFNAYAALYGITPGALATLAVVLTNQSLALSAAILTLDGTVAAANTSAALAAALTAFEAAIGAVVTAVNAASPPVPIVAPAAITITGVNA